MTEASIQIARESTMRGMIWKRFRKHPGAIAGMIVLTCIILACAFAFLSPYDPLKSDMAERYQPPSWQHPMGTDALGRDLMTRVLYGGRVGVTDGLIVCQIT